MKILHFADAHIDTISSGKRDPKSGLPLRALDFLKSLDQIVETAIQERVSLVLFAGDAYRDAMPTPTWQREWGSRMKRLSDAKIPVLMIDGNHDISPTINRASALQEINTYEIPYLHLSKEIRLWNPQDLDGVPLQVLTIPFFPKARFAAFQQNLKEKAEGNDLFAEMETLITESVNEIITQADSTLPLILMAHYSVQGAILSSRQAVSLGQELTLSGSLVKNPAFSYVALGHIHIFQDLNAGIQPPVVYSGSIEHVNFGEAEEAKGFILAEVSNHHCEYEFRRLKCRPMFNREITINSLETMQQEIEDALPAPEKVPGAMVRLVINYPLEWESGVDEKVLRKQMADALEFHLCRRPLRSGRLRVDSGSGISSLPPLELLKKYCSGTQISAEETGKLCALAQEIFTETREPLL